MNMPVADIGDPRYVNQHATDVVALEVTIGGVVDDPDDEIVTATMLDQDGVQVLFSRNATRTDVGVYEIQLATSETAVVGTYTLHWAYAVNGVEITYETFLEIGPYSAAYSRLTPAMRALVDRVMIRFQDLFDSPQGGPHVQAYWQSRFNRGRVADLLAVGLGRLNTVAQPYQTFSLDESGPEFPVEQWGSLLEQATAVEVIKHLRRSYVEQPLLQGGEVTRQDRRDYFDRWGQVLQDEESALKQQLDVFKIRAMTLGHPQVLVSGGVYGRFGPARFRAGSAAPRGYFLWRVGT